LPGEFFFRAPGPFPHGRIAQPSHFFHQYVFDVIRTPYRAVFAFGEPKNRFEAFHQFGPFPQLLD